MKILIADDHGIVREGIKLLLSDLSTDLSVLEAADRNEVLAAVSGNPDLDLILLDLYMPGVTDLDLLAEISNHYSRIPVIILSATEDTYVMQRAIDRGAAGFIPKSAAQAVMTSAIRLVLAGGVYIPPAMVQHPDESSADAPARVTHTSQLDLTNRQLEVLKLLGEGKSNKIIARELGLSAHTVKIHVTAIFKALGVSNRTEAAVASRELDMPPPG
ncbi:MAG: response regulator transcription factor [Gammaproteobacteria bacterium]|nr:response regulator transcription factor [Gammaproteobacteria bacterium]